MQKMFASLKDILDDARTRQYAVPAFACAEDVMVRPILETAENLDSSGILLFLTSLMQGNDWVCLPEMTKAVVDHHPIPVVLHLNHADSLD